MKISTGSNQLNQLLDGGLEPGAITHIYGESGSGKTGLTLQASIETIKNGGTTVYIATPRFMVERFKQLCYPERPEEIGSNLIIFEPKNIDKLKAAIQNAAHTTNKTDVKLITIDSPTYYGYRDTEKQKTKKQVTEQLKYLLAKAKKQKTAILITNQIYTDINKEKNKATPIGGKTLQDISKTTIKLEKKKKNKRKAIKTKPKPQKHTYLTIKQTKIK
ncbi:ATPase domain-containing protein [Methanonatronarchaeum sp. AMET-Sl]|uniref:ATPase domain-containing protein n=1 Tax=Methanonatronarchaeum sp. AMET-Sl TaxID=3037654 RepID=UPI00244E20DF|nr:ATPase domain-containing protein [Methanonatronarchaeum sp. AMET-Sl]WGI17623.1 ATPase domain-containing protein [Methanonatronarchaeum sp. AMET-Sl]